MKAFLVLAAGAMLLAATACSGDDDAPPATEAVPEDAQLGVSATGCPDVETEDQRQFTDFRPVTKGAPKLVADLYISEIGGSRDYCVVPESYDSPDIAAKIVSYSLVLPDDGANCGEQYGTFVEPGSDELLNFAFAFHVYGKCRPVNAEIVVRDRGTDYTYRVATQVGPKCTTS